VAFGLILILGAGKGISFIIPLPEMILKTFNAFWGTLVEQKFNHFPTLLPYP